MIEIQVVPNDIRRRVQYLFLDHHRMLTDIIFLSIILANVIDSMAATPTIIRRVYKDNFLKSMRVERGIQHERLRENVQQMASLERTLEEHRIRVEKLMTIYGLDRTLGQGGFSFPFHHNDGRDVELTDAQQREVALRHAMQRLQQQ